jgi:hypothetical protein
MHALHVSISINWLISVGFYFYFSGKVGFGHPQKAIPQPQLINQVLLSTNQLTKSRAYVQTYSITLIKQAHQHLWTALDRAYVVD